MFVEYCCPKCKGEVRTINDFLSCLGCGAAWPIKEGIPCFSVGSSYWGFASPEAMHALLQIAQNEGWLEAVKCYSDASNTHTYDYLYQYAVSEARADFQFLIPLSSQSTVLDVGCGWGNISVSLARNTQHVVALDSTFENAKFVSVRAEQEKIHNIQTVCADAHALPFQDDTFDLIVMNGVLEWTARDTENRNALRVQLEVLDQIHNCLKRPGWLYLGIENRFSIKLLCGARDPHTGLRFGTVLPRAVGDAYSRIIRHKGYSELIHSARQLQKLLRSAGFSDAKMYFPLPGYQRIRYLLDFTALNVNRFLFQKLRSHRKFGALATIASRFVPSLGIARCFAPCFSVVAAK